MGAAEDLLLLTFIMLVFTLAIGLIPMKSNIRPFYMNLFATAACGLLLGTAFMVILPEGIELILHGLGHHGEHDEHDTEDHDEHDEEDHDEHDEEDHDNLDEEKHEEYGKVELDGPMTGLATIAGIIFLMVIHSFGPDHSHGHGHHKSGKDKREVPQNNFQPVVADEINISDADEDSDSLNIVEASPM